MESPIVEPIDPEQRRPLEICGSIEATVRSDHLGLVQSVVALTQGIIVGIARGSY